MNNSGIYRWTNKITGKIYIGQAIDLTKRQLDFMHFNSCYAGTNINEERKIISFLKLNIVSSIN